MCWGPRSQADIILAGDHACTDASGNPRSDGHRRFDGHAAHASVNASREQRGGRVQLCFGVQDAPVPRSLGGESAQDVSRKPPNVAVTMPQQAQRTAASLLRLPFMAPITAKAPTPRASPHHRSGPSPPPLAFKTLPSGSSFHRQKVPAATAAAIQKYSISLVQKGILLSRIASRNVPPPTAVITPTIVPPSRSIPDMPAVMAPDAAKAIVPA